MLVEQLARWATQIMEMAGMAVIIGGAALATLRYAADGVRTAAWGAEAYDAYRANLGRGILLGLELLVAADIVKTITAKLDLESVGALAVIVLIRTFLSFSLEVEIKGRWPWRG
ncbi:MAG: DUF1622 domain-containing protein [Alphaproteobacteria bacterium]|nr:DUF1622 domain-containing protein [Alphaproteobacteria bacterium]